MKTKTKICGECRHFEIEAGKRWGECIAKYPIWIEPDGSPTAYPDCNQADMCDCFEEKTIALDTE